MTASWTAGAPASPWQEMLAARPIRNSAVQADPDAGGGLQLHLRRQRPWYSRPPLGWLLKFRDRKTLLLDPVGASVWAMCDDRASVGELVERFAAEHRLTFHESRVAVTDYVRALVDRGALAIALAGEDPGAAGPGGIA